MSGLRSTRWRAGLGLLVCAVLAGGWFWLRSSSGSGISERPHPEAATEAIRARIRATADRSELAAAGQQVLSGRIVDGDGVPVGGVLVSASAVVASPALGALPCGCANGCETKLLDCGYAHAAEALLARLQAQTDAPLQVARTTSAADGSFTLRGLEL